MERVDMEKLIAFEYLHELSLIKPEINNFENEAALESYIKANFSKTQQEECFTRASVTIFDGLSKAVKA